MSAATLARIVARQHVYDCIAWNNFRESFPGDAELARLSWLYYLTGFFGWRPPFYAAKAATDW